MNVLAIVIWAAVAVSSVLLVAGLLGSRPRPRGPVPALHDLSCHGGRRIRSPRRCRWTTGQRSARGALLPPVV